MYAEIDIHTPGKYITRVHSAHNFLNRERFAAYQIWLYEFRSLIPITFGR